MQRFGPFLKAGARPMDSCSRSGRGIGMLAKSLNVPVVAMRIKRSVGIEAARKKTARPGEVSVEIAAPVKLAESATQEQIAERLEAVMRDIE